MRKYSAEFIESQMLVPMLDFLESFNKNMPKDFPRATIILLKKFKDNHSMLFRGGDLWSLEKHRKKIIDWLPQQADAS